MSPSACRPLAVLVVLVALVASGCSKSKPPEVIDWYTTAGPLPMATGEVRLTPEHGEKLVFVVVQAQFDGRKVWTDTGKKEGFRYTLDLHDFHLLTADGQSAPNRVQKSGGTWSPGGSSYTDEPEANSRWTFGFAVDQKAVDAGGLKIQFRELPALELSAEKRVTPPTR